MAGYIARLKVSCNTWFRSLILFINCLLLFSESVQSNTCSFVTQRIVSNRLYVRPLVHLGASEPVALN